MEKAYTDAQGAETAAPAAYAYDALRQRTAIYDSTGDTEYTYDGADNLAAIIYPDGTRVSYEYDLNDNLIKVTDREGLATTYVYDAINRITELHRPNSINTYYTYNEADRITELVNSCDDCGWVVSRYAYTYDERGFIISETAVESLAGYAYDDKHNGKHEDGRHDDLYPHGNKHAKHDKDASFAYQIVETDRTFTYDDAGKLLSAVETEDKRGTYVYSYEYDGMGNRTAAIKTNAAGTVVESRKYVYNESNQLVSVKLFDGKKTTSVSYTYDADGNLTAETGRDGTDKVELTYTYTVENRLEAVYDGKELLMAAAYDGDGNRVFQLNYNLHTDEDWKENSGNGNGNNKDNAGNGNSGNKGNATNAETSGSQNQSGILFPISSETSDTEEYLISLINTSGKEKNYELIEYINDVNREYTEVLVEQNINGTMDTAYVYGAAIGIGSDRLSLDRFDSSTGYYLYDPKGSVTGITNEEGQIYQSYCYSVFGEITFGAPQYENEYTYNGESYNPNIKSQYLRARYYCVVTADFLTEDSYLGNIREPLTLNRYNYCVGNPVNYADPSGNKIFQDLWKWLFGDPDAPKAVPLNPQPITTPSPSPSPEPWLLPVPWGEQNDLYGYGSDILPVGGIGYVFRAPGGQSEEYIKYLEQQITNAEENTMGYDCEDITQELFWIPSVILNLEGETSQEKKLKELIDGVNKGKNKTDSLFWDQNKINKVWQASKDYYVKTGVQVDPRLMLAIIIQEGTGSFNTDSTNPSPDGGNGPQSDFDTDIASAIDILGGKIIAYANYQKDFSAARQEAYDEGLPGIKEYDDILHYLNWETPRIGLISEKFIIGVYADHSDWNRGVRQIYSELAFSGAAAQYTEYAKSIGTQKMYELAESYDIEISQVTFKAVKNGMDSNKVPNGNYVIIGILTGE